MNRRPDRPRLRAQHLQPRPSRHRRRRAPIEAFADAILTLDDSMPTGTYVDMCSKLPLVDPAKIRDADHRDARRVRRHRELRRPDRVLQAPAQPRQAVRGDGRASRTRASSRRTTRWSTTSCTRSSRSPTRSTAHEDDASHALLAAALRRSPCRCARRTIPTAPIRIIVPFGPGGFTDVVARILQKELAPAIGQADRDREQAGRRLDHRHRRGRQGQPDGYTLRDGVHHARDQPAPLQEDALRPDQATSRR